jgi:hypothetical protein
LLLDVRCAFVGGRPTDDRTRRRKEQKLRHAVLFSSKQLETP